MVDLTDFNFAPATIRAFQLSSAMPTFAVTFMSFDYLKWDEFEKIGNIP